MKKGIKSRITKDLTIELLKQGQVLYNKNKRLSNFQFFNILIINIIFKLKQMPQNML